MMKLSLDALLVLDAIDRKGSFAAAAEALHRVPSAITYAVQKLEQDLDVVLYDRNGHRAKLTLPGQTLLQEGRHLLEAAQALEAQVKRIATGWEQELRIAVSDLIDIAPLFGIIDEFDRQESGTRIRLTHEVFGGAWDALDSGRADLAIGAPDAPPAGSGFSTKLIGEVEFVFAVAPNHPLACVPHPLKPEDIRQFRAIAVTDSSRNLPPRTSGLLSGQQVLGVANLRMKLAAQIAGLGVGYVPRTLAGHAIAAGELIVCEVEQPRTSLALHCAWMARHGGKAQQWLVRRIGREESLQSWLAA